MKGLLVKDIELMKQQKQFFLMVIVMGVVLNITGSMSFAVGYFTIITAIFTNTTMSYDEYDNGFAFLLTLPVERKQYVTEKYMLGAGLTFLAWGIGTGISLITNGITKTHDDMAELFAGGASTIPIAFLMLSVFLPLSIYFGVEKGRYMGLVVWIAVISVIYALVKTNHFSDSQITAWLDSLNWKTLAPMIVFVTLMVYLVSYKISETCMQKKEF